MTGGATLTELARSIATRMGGIHMSSSVRLRSYLYGSVAIGAMSLATTAGFAAPCTRPGAPTHTHTKSLTAVQIPGHPLRSFDISWVNPDRAEMYFADRSNAGVQVI